MPVGNLGAAIGGKYQTQTDFVSPFLKGMQVAQQQDKQGELRKYRIQQAKDKKDEKLAAQIGRSTLLRDVDPLDQKMAQEEIENVIGKVYKLQETEGPSSYLQASKILNTEAPAIIAKYKGRNQAWREIRRKINTNEMSPGEQEHWNKILATGDTRLAAGMVDDLYGSGVDKDTFVPMISTRKPVDLNSRLNTQIDNAYKQNIGSVQSVYPHLVEELNGIPRDKTQLNQILKSKGIRLTAPEIASIQTMEDIANREWSDGGVQFEYLRRIEPDLRERFGGKGQISKNPEALAYAKNKYLEDAKNMGGINTSLKGVPQDRASSTNSGAGDYKPTTRAITLNSTYTDGRGKVGIEPRSVTTLYSISHAPTKDVHQNSENTFNTDGNTRIADGKARDIEYGNMDVVPVWKVGKEKGKIVPDSFRNNPKYNNAATIEYKVVSFGNYQEKTSDGVYEPRSAYTPTSEIIGALQNKGRKESGAALKKGYADAQKIASEKNAEMLSTARQNVKKGKTLTGEASKTTVSSVPSASRAEWKAGGWNDAQIDQAVKIGKIKVK
jgi:hypothetical protein